MALAYRQGVRDYGHLPNIRVARGASARSEAALDATRFPSADPCHEQDPGFQSKAMKKKKGEKSTSTCKRKNKNKGKGKSKRELQ